MTTQKRVLVLGASGFVGYSLFEALTKREDLDVWGTYQTNRYGRIKPYSKKLIKADLTKEKRVSKVLCLRFDVVIQAAAYSTGAKDAKERPYIQITPNAVVNSLVFQAAFDNHVSQVIFPSCSVMYPSRDEPSKETDVDRNNLLGPYFGAANMKLYSEAMCQFFAGLGRAGFTAIRPSNIYGPHDRFDPERSHVFGATIRKVMEAKDGKVVVWGQGQEVRDFLYVDDFVRFVELVIDRQDYPFDIFNVGLGQSITIRELVEKVVGASGKNLEIVYDPSGPTIGTKISMNINKAKEKFGWQPRVSLDEGIAKTIAWYRQNKTKEAL